MGYTSSLLGITSPSTAAALKDRKYLPTESKIIAHQQNAPAKSCLPPPESLQCAFLHIGAAHLLQARATEVVVAAGQAQAAAAEHLLKAHRAALLSRLKLLLRNARVASGGGASAKRSSWNADCLV